MMEGDNKIYFGSFYLFFMHTFLPFGEHLKTNFNDQIVALYCTVLKYMVRRLYIIMLTALRCLYWLCKLSFHDKSKWSHKQSNNCFKMAYQKHFEPSLKKKRKLPKSASYSSSLESPSSCVIRSPLYSSRNWSFKNTFVVNTPLPGVI